MSRTIDLPVELSTAFGAAPAEGLDVAAVFAAEGDYVLTALRRLGVRPSELEDGMHDVFIAVHRHKDRYDPERSLRAWLFGFALRVASNYRRSRRRRREGGEPDFEPADERPRADALLETDARRALLLRALEALSEERRAVLVLHDLDGISMPEIARALEIPLNTAYSRLRLAREDITAAVRRLTRGAS